MEQQGLDLSSSMKQLKIETTVPTHQTSGKKDRDHWEKGNKWDKPKMAPALPGEKF